jgi:hypothetical protein
VSAAYGQRQPAPALVYSTIERLPLRIATLLWPTAAPFDAPPEVRPRVKNGSLNALVFGDGEETIELGDHT